MRHYTPLFILTEKQWILLNINSVVLEPFLRFTFFSKDGFNPVFRCLSYTN